MGAFSIANKTRYQVRVSRFARMKEAVLGKRYELSVALLTPRESRAVTRRSKRKDKISNVLAFPLSPVSGEVLLCPAHTGPYTLEYLFIHGMLHLKGLQHGATMDAAEERWLKRFKICKRSSQV